jgi:hypothetical protein
MDPDEIQATLDNLQSMQDEMQYNFAQLVGYGQGQTQNSDNSPTTSAQPPVVGNYPNVADNISPSTQTDNDLIQQFKEIIEKTLAGIVGTANAGENTANNSNSGNVQFDMENYLKRTREIESSNGTNTGAPDALAQGDFQFIPSTWEETKTRLIVEGHPEAANWTLDDRNDPEKARIAAENLAEFNRKQLQKDVGGQIGEVETYSAHLLGASGASALLNADPNSLAKNSISEAALKANEGVFKDTGASVDTLTAKQLIDSISKFYGGQSGQRVTADTSRPNIMRGADLMADSGAPGSGIWDIFSKLKDLGVNTVGPEIGSNMPPNFAINQRSGLPPPRGMAPSMGSSDENGSGSVPTPTMRSDIFEFLNYFGIR